VEVDGALESKELFQGKAIADWHGNILRRID
jgi:hypothetical protein